MLCAKVLDDSDQCLASLGRVLAGEEDASPSRLFRACRASLFLLGVQKCSTTSLANQLFDQYGVAEGFPFDDGDKFLWSPSMLAKWLIFEPAQLSDLRYTQ